jgi:hypothetical protein
VRKKIPTITRPDPAYVASLRPEGEDLAREEVQRVETISRSESEKALLVEEVYKPEQGKPSAPMPRPRQEIAEGIAPLGMVSPPQTRRTAATRKIDVRVNALERQEEALIDCGVDPAHVIRAALRRAVKNWQLGPDFVDPSEEQRTRITEWRARTSLAVDANALAALLRAHDPLEVLSKWTLIRGQVEPRVWAQIDLILSELHERADRLAGTLDIPTGGSLTQRATNHCEQDRSQPVGT